MTKIGGARKTPRGSKKASPGGWKLKDAKARLSEVVRRAKTDGPQRVTIHGRDAVLVVAEEEYRRLSGRATGERLVRALAASPFRDVELVPPRAPMPVREVEFP